MIFKVIFEVNVLSMMLLLAGAEMNMNGGSEYTMIPGKKKMKQPEKPIEATPISIKPRKGKFKIKYD